MIIQIHDDFDLEKISESGQCFRVRTAGRGHCQFLTGEHVLDIRDCGEGRFSVSCTPEEWAEVWTGYFDLDRCYRDIFDREYGKNEFVSKAMLFGRGLRILRQDPWETLITFILSQRKNIPAISMAVEQLAAAYGHEIVTGCGTFHSFPSPSELAEADEEGLRACALGYRAPYVRDAVSRVLEGEIDLNALSSCSDEDLLRELQKIYGVGRKVADCVALFAYGRTGCVPVDVWIARAIEQDCAGESPFELYGENAGIMQQYVYYYEKHRTRPSAGKFVRKRREGNLT